MESFAAGAFDVLLCTTIIESGLDIPNANTILIDRADRFGLGEPTGRITERLTRLAEAFEKGGLKPKVESFIVSLITPNLERVNESLQRFLDEHG